jgi:hypothetical protein
MIHREMGGSMSKAEEMRKIMLEQAKRKHLQEPKKSESYTVRMTEAEFDFVSDIVEHWNSFGRRMIEMRARSNRGWVRFKNRSQAVSVQRVLGIRGRYCAEHIKLSISRFSLVRDNHSYFPRKKTGLTGRSLGEFIKSDIFPADIYPLYMTSPLEFYLENPPQRVEIGGIDSEEYRLAIVKAFETFFGKPSPEEVTDNAALAGKELKKIVPVWEEHVPLLYYEIPSPNLWASLACRSMEWALKTKRLKACSLSLMKKRWFYEDLCKDFLKDIGKWFD